MSEQIEPLTDSEMKQVVEGVALNIRQPSQAPRNLNWLLRALNISLGRINHLESRVAELESQNSKPQKQPVATGKKQTSPLADPVDSI